MKSHNKNFEERLNSLHSQGKLSPFQLAFRLTLE